MSDHLTPTQRHRCMSRIPHTATKPELLVRRWLWAHGYRYRLNVRSVPGKPDIVMRKYRTAIFVNGCFWHGHEGCSMFVMPKSNTDFWKNKIENNRKCDQRNYNILIENGWQVLVVWQCQLSKDNLENTMQLVTIALNQNLLRIIANT